MQRSETKPMNAIVVFASRYGNTGKIARSIAAGLQLSGANASCLETKEVDIQSLGSYDLICVGAPTEAFSAYKPMKEFLGELRSVNLAGKYGFAFDTKLGWRFSGSAARYIEKELLKLGLQIISPCESAKVKAVKEGGRITGAVLESGGHPRFVEIGKKVGGAISTKLGPLSA